MVVTYHMTIDLAWALRRPTAYLKDIITHETGHSLSGWDVRRRLKEAQARGYIVLPVCDHHDARGYCRGHTDLPSDCRRDTTPV